jgi:hypothetical protein
MYSIYNGEGLRTVLKWTISALVRLTVSLAVFQLLTYQVGDPEPTADTSLQASGLHRCGGPVDVARDDTAGNRG